jgi:hypothetical protein
MGRAGGKVEPTTIVDAMTNEEVHDERAFIRRGTSVGAVLLSAAVAALAVAGSAAADGASKQEADVVGQGPAGPVVSEEGARLTRTRSRLRAKLAMPTPEPGSYVYPGPNAWHPNGTAPGFPEVYTLWVFVFNYPDLCSAPCDGNDIAVTAPAHGGAFGVDGIIAYTSNLRLAGKVTRDTTPFVGSPLLEPLTAEVHLAVAPHGKVDPSNLQNQLTRPVGSPPIWWLAFFLPGGSDAAGEEDDD